MKDSFRKDAIQNGGFVFNYVSQCADSAEEVYKMYGRVTFHPLLILSFFSPVFFCKDLTQTDGR